MAAYVCTFAGGKGGVGRTTTVLNTGRFLQEEGYDTAIVDADLGMADAGALLEVDPEPTLHDVLAGQATVSEALADVPGGVTFLGGDQALDAYANADAAGIGTVIDALRPNYDAVLVDTSAGIHHETTVALGVADGTVLVTTCRDAAIYDASKTAQLAERVDGSIVGLVLTRVRDDAEFADVRDRVDLPVLGAVPDDDSMAGDPLVGLTDSTPAAESHLGLAGNLIRVFFEDDSPDELDPAFEESWFDRRRSGGPRNQSPDDSDDVLGLFN